MQQLPTSPDGLPDEIETETVECPGCGTTGYVAAEQGTHMGPRDARIPRCEDCIRRGLRLDLADDDRDSLRALDRIRAMGLLPFRDPEGDLITEVDVRRGPPGAGDYLHKLTTIVSRECPECGHDRADHTVWNIWTVEGGEGVTCRACDHTIEEVSSL